MLINSSLIHTPRGALRSRMEWLERNALFLLPLLVGLYFVMVLPAARRPLWYDELFTYYVSMSRNLEEFWGRILHVDLNPPLNYLFVRASIFLFGDSPLAVRLPSMLAFLAASLSVLVIVRRKAGNLFALTAMVLTWSFGFLRYATEARPYALILAFLSLAVLCWMSIRPDEPVSAAHWGLAGSIAGMLLSHCFAAFFVAPFVAGELVRGIRRKKFDSATWFAILGPMLLVVTYIPLLIRAQRILVPPAFLPSLTRAITFYEAELISMGPLVLLPFLARPFVLMLLAILLLISRGSKFRPVLAAHELIFLWTAFLMPAVVMGYLSWVNSAFWPRYGIGIVVVLSIGVTCQLARLTNRNVFAAGLIAVLTLMALGVQAYPALSSYRQPAAVPSTVYRQILPELPFVAASGLTFLEMDHREDNRFVKRLYYLTDTPSAIRYAHATIFEGLPILARYFPVRGAVAPYHSFMATHDRFLVFATPGYPEDWLLDKLRDDRAEIRQVCQIHTDYRDQMLYEVTVNHQ